jgi:hypothetical protein
MCNCARASVFCAEIVPTLAMALINKSNVCVCPYVYELSARECMLLVIYTRHYYSRRYARSAHSCQMLNVYILSQEKNRTRHSFSSRKFWQRIGPAQRKLFGPARTPHNYNIIIIVRNTSDENHHNNV